MEYAQGRIGRVFAARLYSDEPVYEAIETLAAREGIESAIVALVGGARKATIVTGPKSTTGPLEPRLQGFDDAREMIGLGTIHSTDEGPALHLHAGFGRDDTALVGCPRVHLSAYLVLEAFIVEVTGLDASRVLDPETGLKLLKFAAPNTVAFD